MTGLEPATSWSQTKNTTNCATSISAPRLGRCCRMGRGTELFYSEEVDAGFGPAREIYSYGFADRHIRPLCQSTIAEGIPIEENPVKDNRFSRPLQRPRYFTFHSSAWAFTRTHWNCQSIKPFLMVVSQARLELATSALSGQCSNHLSYQDKWC